jgi:IMP dehydrogenase
MVNLDSMFSRSVRVRIPLASSPMDTVTGWRLAVALARVGAIGVVHRNMSIEEQVRHVRKVKEAAPGIEDEAVIVGPEEQLSRVLEAMESRGVGAALVASQGRVLSFIVSRGARQEYWASKARGLASLMDVHTIEPLLDDEGRLVVAAAISPYDVERAKRLEEAGADVLVVDVAHAHNENVVSAVSRLVKEAGVDVVVGNVGTRDAVLEYATRVEGVAGFRAGIGSGSICSTSEVTGAYVPTLTALWRLGGH